MNLYDFKAKDINGRETALSEYRGKVLLIVNTASKCGFTPQYEGLEALYRKYKDRGLEILGFPCNQFLKQEPGSDGEISSFCRLTYGVSFPMFSKVDVNGENASPLYRYLTEQAPFQGFEQNKESGRKIQGVVQQYYPENLTGNGIKWNFTKFLISTDGTVLSRFEPTVTPEEMEPAIETALAGVKKEGQAE